MHIEIGALLTLMGFVLGFFTNLLAMRKMFTSKSEFTAYKLQDSKTFDEYKTESETRLKERFKAVELMCDLKRAACAPMSADVAEIKKDIKELFRDLRRLLATKENGNAV